MMVLKLIFGYIFLASGAYAWWFAICKSGKGNPDGPREVSWKEWLFIFLVLIVALFVGICLIVSGLT